MRNALQAAVLSLCVLTACRDAPRPRHSDPPEQFLAPEFYTSEPITGRIVDSASTRPIAGACVVAIWRKVEARNEEWDGIFRSFATCSDSEGRFSIPRWGPRPVPGGDYLDRRDPELWVVKRGFAVSYFDNDGFRRPLGPLRPDDPWQVVKLPPAKMPPHDRDSYMRSAAGSSRWNGKDLELEKPGVSDIARSLAAANPGEPGMPKRIESPLFWSEWSAARKVLPPELRSAVPDPPYCPTDVFIRVAGPGHE